MYFCTQVVLHCPCGSQCMWRPEVSVRCLPSLVCLIFWVTEPGVYQCWLTGQRIPGGLLCLLSAEMIHHGVGHGCQPSELRSSCLSQEPFTSAIFQLHRSRSRPVSLLQSQWLGVIWFDPVLFWDLISIFSPDWPQAQQCCISLYLVLQVCSYQTCFRFFFF